MGSKHITNTLGTSRDKCKVIPALFQVDEEAWRDLLMPEKTMKRFYTVF
jgi:hypothetical protein